MSMLQAFERLLNRKRADREDREQRADVEKRDEVPGDKPSEEEMKLVCRACGYRGSEAYCPECLADTMRPERRKRTPKPHRVRTEH